MTSNITVGLQQRAIEEALGIEQDKSNLLDRAIKLGGTLVEIKENLKHGEWKVWVESGMPIGERQCRKYMQVFNDQEYLPKRNPNAVLGIDSALKEIRLAKNGATAAPEPALPRTIAKGLYNKMDGADPDVRKHLVRLMNGGSQDRLKAVAAIIDPDEAFLAMACKWRQRQVHPDMGGSVEDSQEVNRLVEIVKNG